MTDRDSQGQTGTGREKQGETGRYRVRQGQAGRDRDRQGIGLIDIIDIISIKNLLLNLQI